MDTPVVATFPLSTKETMMRSTPTVRHHGLFEQENVGEKYFVRESNPALVRVKHLY